MSGIMLVGVSRGLFAQVDEADYERVIAYKWYANVNPWTTYAKTDQLRGRSGGKSTYLHNFIMQPPLGLVVDHLDHDGLNCTHSNLQICTQSANARRANLRYNKTGSQYRGVYYHRPRDKFAAEITINYKKHYLGIFPTEVEAAQAYNEAVKALLGEGFPLNNV